MYCKRNDRLVYYNVFYLLLKFGDFSDYFLTKVRICHHLKMWYFVIFFKGFRPPFSNFNSILTSPNISVFFWNPPLSLPSNTTFPRYFLSIQRTDGPQSADHSALNCTKNTTIYLTLMWIYIYLYKRQCVTTYNTFTFDLIMQWTR